MGIITCIYACLTPVGENADVLSYPQCRFLRQVHNSKPGGSEGGCDDMGVLPKIQRLGLMQVTGYIKSNQLRDNRFLVQSVR